MRRRELTYSVDEKTGCWNCTSHKQHDKYSYPRICRNYKVIPLNRYMYQKHKGEIPFNMVVRHTCDNKMCVNPSHLIIGTQRDNVRDMMERNLHRSYPMDGENNPNVKIYEDDVYAIRNSKKTNTELAKQYGVNPPAIYKIKKRISWRCLPERQQ